MSKQEKTKMQEGSQASLTQAILLKDLNINTTKKKNSLESFSTWVRALAQNWRQGTVACKGRSDVARSTKKPWKQKGTGRARAGSARSPIWRGGGVTFGPQARVKKLRINKKARLDAFRGILLDYVSRGKVFSLDWSLNGDTPKTSSAHDVLKTAGLNNQRITLFLSKNDALSYASFSNIPSVRVLYFDQANAADLTCCEGWVFLKKDTDSFKEMVAQWI